MPAAQRRRGVVPNDLRQRLDRVTPSFAERQAARMLAHSLDGLAPSQLTAEERAQLDDTWGELGRRRAPWRLSRSATARPSPAGRDLSVLTASVVSGGCVA